MSLIKPPSNQRGSLGHHKLHMETPAREHRAGDLESMRRVFEKYRPKWHHAVGRAAVRLASAVRLVIKNLNRRSKDGRSN